MGAGGVSDDNIALAIAMAAWAARHGHACAVLGELPDVVARQLANPFGSTVARSMFARGLYDADTNVFTAYKIGIHLIEP